MRAHGIAWLVVLLLLIGVAGVASAQVQLGGVNIEGEIEAGALVYAERPGTKDRAKFEEYRDMTPGPQLWDLQLRLFTPDERYFGEFGGAKWGRDDQDYFLSIGELGIWQFDFLWDQTPHLISTNARLLAVETHRGVFELDAPGGVRPPLANHNSAPTREIGVRWDKAEMGFGYSVTPDFDVAVKYTRTRKEGDKPMGMGFGSPGGQFYEVLQPIEQTVHDVRLTGAYATPRYQVQFTYALSLFQNDLDRVIASNPLCPGACGNSADTGQTSLPPSNLAHTVSVAGGINLPLRTRLNANAAWSLHLQNDAFLPMTINSAQAGNPDLALPKPGLDGNVQTWLLFLQATSRPFDRVTFGAKYRFFDYSDHSRVITFQDIVVNDQSTTSGAARRAGRWSYQKQNADLDARTRLLQSLALTTGVGWERWDRNEHREVPISDEFYAKAALDATPTEWLLARLTYRPSFRRISNYNSRAHAEHSVVEDPAEALQGQSILLRKFDESDRDRQKVDGLLQFSLGDSMTVSPTAGYRYDDFVASPLGVQQATGWSAGIDFSWTPIERVVLSTGYMYEQTHQRMRSRSRPVTGTTTFDFVDFDWISNITDTVHTAYAGVKAALLPKKLDLSVNANYSTALGEVTTRNPVAPASGTAAQQETARAKRFPAYEDTLLSIETALKYHITKSWSAKVAYVFETFEKSNWQTDTLNPFVPGQTSIWLGNDARNYTAHYFGISIGYAFK